LNCYNIRQVVTKAIELKEMLRGGKCEGAGAADIDGEILKRLAASTKVLIEGRDEGFINNIRRLQNMKFLNLEEAEIAISIYSKPDPVIDFDGLIKLIKVLTRRLPLFKENLTC
jgi:hypothetical protein